MMRAITGSKDPHVRTDRLVFYGVIAFAIAALCFATPAAAQTKACHSLDLQVAIESTEEPECLGGVTDGVEFRGEWEYIQITDDDRFIAVTMQRAGTRSAFYRPRLESAVESLISDSEDFEWSIGVDHEDFSIRRFDVTFSNDTHLPCAGFMDLKGRSMGSEVKSVVYGYFCNLNGIAFADGEIVDMLSHISY
jgi:hypothetical protein